MLLKPFLFTVLCCMLQFLIASNFELNVNVYLYLSQHLSSEGQTTVTPTVGNIRGELRRHRGYLEAQSLTGGGDGTGEKTPNHLPDES